MCNCLLSLALQGGSLLIFVFSACNSAWHSVSWKKGSHAVGYPRVQGQTLVEKLKPLPSSVFPTPLTSTSWGLKVWRGAYILISIHQNSYNFYSKFKIQSCISNSTKYLAWTDFVAYCGSTASHLIFVYSLMNMNLDENIGVIYVNINIH